MSRWIFCIAAFCAALFLAQDVVHARPSMMRYRGNRHRSSAHHHSRQHQAPREEAAPQGGSAKKGDGAALLPGGTGVAAGAAAGAAVERSTDKDVDWPYRILAFLGGVAILVGFVGAASRRRS
jgi:hypothetical protein